MANKKKQAKHLAANNGVEGQNAVVVTDKKKTAVGKNNNGKVAANGKKKRTAKEFFQGIKAGIKGIISELKKVTWPKAGEALKNTGIVLGVCAIFLVVCLGIDLGLSAIFDAIVG